MPQTHNNSNTNRLTTLETIISLLGLFLAIEGALYAGAPNFAKRMAAEVMKMEPSDLRKGGMAGLAIGVALVWLVKG